VTAGTLALRLGNAREALERLDRAQALAASMRRSCCTGLVSACVAAHTEAIAAADAARHRAADDPRMWDAIGASTAGRRSGARACGYEEPWRSRPRSRAIFTTGRRCGATRAAGGGRGGLRPRDRAQSADYEPTHPFGPSAQTPQHITSRARSAAVRGFATGAARSRLVMRSPRNARTSASMRSPLRCSSAARACGAGTCGTTSASTWPPSTGSWRPSRRAPSRARRRR